MNTTGELASLGFLWGLRFSPQSKDMACRLIAISKFVHSV